MRTLILEEQKSTLIVAIFLGVCLIRHYNRHKITNVKQIGHIIDAHIKYDITYDHRLVKHDWSVVSKTLSP